LEGTLATGTVKQWTRLDHRLQPGRDLACGGIALRRQVSPAAA